MCLNCSHSDMNVQYSRATPPTRFMIVGNQSTAWIILKRNGNEINSYHRPNDILYSHTPQCGYSLRYLPFIHIFRVSKEIKTCWYPEYLPPPLYPPTSTHTHTHSVAISLRYLPFVHFSKISKERFSVVKPVPRLPTSHPL